MGWGDVRYFFAMGILVIIIKSPNEVWRLIVFEPFLIIIIIIIIPLLLFAVNLSDQILRDL